MKTIENVREAASELIGGRCIMSSRDADQFAETNGIEGALRVIAEVRRNLVNPRSVFSRYYVPMKADDFR